MNRLNFYVVCFVLLLVAAVTPSRAQQNDTTARFMINFPVNATALDWKYGENRYALAELNRFFSNIEPKSIDSIRITGSASPEGGEQINHTYANMRARSMRDCLVEAYGCNPNQIAVRAQWQTWAEMIKLLNSDADIPKKSEVMILLTAWHVPYSERLKLLTELNYTESYQHIKEKTFPVLRNVHAVVIFYKVKQNEKAFVVHDMKAEYEKLPEQIAKKYDVLSAVVLPADPLEYKRPADWVATTAPNKVADTLQILAPAKFLPADSSEKTITKRQKPLFALKTNLLYDAATLVNLAIEIPIGKHWSIAAELIFPWWLNEKKQNSLQIHNANLEVKYWFAPRENQKRGKFATMTGWFAGVYGGAALYDIEYKGKGYQGESIFSTGIMGGYAHSIGRSLRLEYSLGVGYMQTHYRSYESKFSEVDNQWYLYRQNSDKLTWIGPTHLKVSLVWMLNRNVKK